MDRPFAQDREWAALAGTLHRRKPGITHQRPRVSQNIEDGHFKLALLLVHPFVRSVGGWRSVRPLYRHLQVGFFDIVHESFTG